MSQLRFWLQFAALNKVTSQGPAGPPRATCGTPELPQVAELGQDAPSPAHSVLSLASHSEHARIFKSMIWNSEQVASMG